MSAYGKNVLPVTTQVASPKRVYLDARAARLNWSRAEFVEQIIEFYFAMGCPPVSDIEAQVSSLPIPSVCRVEMRPFWKAIASAHLAVDSNAKVEAARIMNRKEAPGGADDEKSASNRAPRKRTRSAP